MRWEKVVNSALVPAQGSAFQEFGGRGYQVRRFSTRRHNLPFWYFQPEVRKDLIHGNLCGKTRFDKQQEATIRTIVLVMFFEDDLGYLTICEELAKRGYQRGPKTVKQLLHRMTKRALRMCERLGIGPEPQEAEPRPLQIGSRHVEGLEVRIYESRPASESKPLDTHQFEKRFHKKNCSDDESLEGATYQKPKRGWTRVWLSSREVCRARTITQHDIKNAYLENDSETQFFIEVYGAMTQRTFEKLGASVRVATNPLPFAFKVEECCGLSPSPA